MRDSLLLCEGGPVVVTNLSSGGEGLESESGGPEIASPNREAFRFFALVEVVGARNMLHAASPYGASTLGDSTGAMGDFKAKVV